MWRILTQCYVIYRAGKLGEDKEIQPRDKSMLLGSNSGAMVFTLLINVVAFVLQWTPIPFVTRIPKPQLWKSGNRNAFFHCSNSMVRAICIIHLYFSIPSVTGSYSKTFEDRDLGSSDDQPLVNSVAISVNLISPNFSYPSKKNSLFIWFDILKLVSV